MIYAIEHHVNFWVAESRKAIHAIPMKKYGRFPPV